MSGDVLQVASGFFVGIALAVLYLAMLWMTVCRLVQRDNVGGWLLGTTALRIVALVGALYWFTEGRPGVLLACLLGFLSARVATTRWLAVRGVNRPSIS